MSLQEKERTEELRQYMIPYLENETVCSMDEYVQHGTTSTLQHCLSVMRLSCALASQLHDWHNHQDEGPLHGFAHPHIACRNAVLYFQVCPEIQHIISTHMWPLTLRFVPRSREAVLVCMADKYCSTLEAVVGFFHAAAALLRRKQV